MISSKEALRENPNFQNYIDIGFPDHRDKWRHEKAVYTGGKLQIAGHPVMEDWEDNYMKALADVAAGRGGRVLELGYGMGISASYVQRHDVTEHVIVEANAEVHERLCAFARSHPRVTPQFGFWQDLVETMPAASFDGILFDTYPVQEDELATVWFFFEHAHRLLKPGGVFTYFSDEVSTFSPRHLEALQRAGFRDIRGEVCQVNTPEDCLYWKAKTILVPIVRKD